MSYLLSPRQPIHFLPVDQNQDEFVDELEDRIEHLFAAIDELRKRLVDGPARRELLDRVFRYTHNIKGLAATIGLDSVSDIAHDFENLLVLVRSGNVLLDEPTLDSFEAAAQLLMDQLTSTNPSKGRLATAAEGDSLANNESAVSALPPELLNSLTEEQRGSLTAALEENAKLFIVGTSFDIHNFEEPFRELQENLKRRGEIVSSSPIIQPEQPTKINFRVVYLSKVRYVELRREFERPPAITLKFVRSGDAGTLPLKMISTVPADQIQVKINDLDRLAASAHELFAQTAETLDRISPQVSAEGRSGAADSIERLKQKFLAWENEIVHLRMVSIGRTLQRAVRAGKTAARASGKTVEFQVSGTDIQMDKLMLSAISDPLIHLVRNAVDHGIESAQERLLLGKEKQGRVRIDVTSDGGQSVVTVSDDGRGVNPEFISRAAAQLGVVEEGTPLTLEQSLRLIFRPGFSSMQAVSGVSGRGVGLDAVETAVEQAGGEVRVSSVIGSGTVFEIVLPISFGLLNSTIVKCDDYYYCVDSSLVRSCDEIPETRLEATDGRLLWRSEDESWRILDLRLLLGHPLRQVSDNLLRLLVCELRPQTRDVGKTIPTRVALIVDEVAGREEVLMKGLGSHGGRWRGVAGATELRNGSVALVLDLHRLLRPALS